jgi:hypothetical protein
MNLVEQWKMRIKRNKQRVLSWIYSLELFLDFEKGLAEFDGLTVLYHNFLNCS